PPFKQAQFELMHDRGISREGDLLNLAVEDKIVEKRGSWHYYNDMALGQSGPKAKEYLRENPALMDELTQKVLEKRGLAIPSPAAAETPEPEMPATPAPKGRRNATAATEA